MPNCGSAVSVCTPPSQSAAVSHCAEVAKPAKKPKKTGIPHMASRRSGSTTSW